MTEPTESYDPETGEVVYRRKFHKEALTSYKLLGTKRELFKRKLDAEARRIAADAATTLEQDRDSAKARGGSEAKWVESALYSTDAVTRLAREEEVEWRKKIAGADATKAEALRRIELRAVANGFRWDEVETSEYADDIELEIFVVRMDHMEEVSRRRMSEYEAKEADSRRQQSLFREH